MIVMALLAGCAVTPGQRESQALRDGLALRTNQAKSALTAPDAERAYYEVVDALWLGSKVATPAPARETPLLAARVERAGVAALSLPEVSAWLAKHYDVQLVTLNDVRKLPGADQPLVLAHDGTVRSFLDLIASRIGASWKWSDGKAILFVRETRSYRFDALPFAAQVDNSISNVNGGSAGAGSTGGNGSMAPGIATSSGQSTALTAKVDPFDTVVRDVEAMIAKDGGVVVANRFLASILVTDTPEVHDRIRAYMDAANAMATRQVQFSVKVLSVELDARDSYGINWGVIYRDLDSRFGISTELLSQGTNGANSATISLLNPDSRFDGSEVLLEALSEQGEVSIEQSANLVTLNGRPAPIQVTEDTAYVPSVTALQVPDAGATTSFQGATITTGFAMRLTPLVRSDDDVIVQLELNLSNLRNLRRISPGLGLTAEQPEVDRRQIAPQVLLRSGATMVLSGFEQTRSSGKQRGIGSPKFQALGGGSQSDSRRTTMVVLITPVVI